MMYTLTIVKGSKSMTFELEGPTLLRAIRVKFGTEGLQLLLRNSWTIVDWKRI